jgi:L-seryl-tRNA(Ser) seleniumtransferase
VGGGSAPAFQPESRLVAVVHAKLTASELAKALRGCQPAIVGRIDEGRFLLDLRTVSPDEEIVVLKALAELPG